MLSQKPRKKPQNKRCKDGYPCKRSCISRKKECLGDEMGKFKYGQAKTFLLWEKAQQERLALTNKKRERAGLTPARLNDSKYITAERTKLPQSAIAKTTEKVSDAESPSSQSTKKETWEIPLKDYLDQYPLAIDGLTGKPSLSERAGKYFLSREKKGAMITSVTGKQLEAWFKKNEGSNLPDVAIFVLRSKSPDSRFQFSRINGTSIYQIYDNAKGKHETAVELALYDGKRVPLSVLKDYPGKNNAPSPSPEVKPVPSSLQGSEKAIASSTPVANLTTEKEYRDYQKAYKEQSKALANSLTKENSDRIYPLIGKEYGVEFFQSKENPKMAIAVKDGEAVSILQGAGMQLFEKKLKEKGDSFSISEYAMNEDAMRIAHSSALQKAPLSPVIEKHFPEAVSQYNWLMDNYKEMDAKAARSSSSVVKPAIASSPSDDKTPFEQGVMQYLESPQSFRNDLSDIVFRIVRLSSEKYPVGTPSREKLDRFLAQNKDLDEETKALNSALHSASVSLMRQKRQGGDVSVAYEKHAESIKDSWNKINQKYGDLIDSDVIGKVFESAKTSPQGAKKAPPLSLQQTEKSLEIDRGIAPPSFNNWKINSTYMSNSVAKIAPAIPGTRFTDDDIKSLDEYMNKHGFSVKKSDDGTFIEIPSSSKYHGMPLSSNGSSQVGQLLGKIEAIAGYKAVRNQKEAAKQQKRKEEEQQREQDRKVALDEKRQQIAQSPTLKSIDKMLKDSDYRNEAKRIYAVSSVMNYWEKPSAKLAEMDSGVIVAMAKMAGVKPSRVANSKDEFLANKPPSNKNAFYYEGDDGSVLTLNTRHNGAADKQIRQFLDKTFTANGEGRSRYQPTGTDIKMLDTINRVIDSRGYGSEKLKGLPDLSKQERAEIAKEAMDTVNSRLEDGYSADTVIDAVSSAWESRNKAIAPSTSSTPKTTNNPSRITDNSTPVIRSKKGKSATSKPVAAPEPKTETASAIAQGQGKILSKGKLELDGFAKATATIPSYKEGTKVEDINGSVLGDYIIHKGNNNTGYQVTHIPTGVTILNNAQINGMMGKGTLESAKYVTKILHDSGVIFPAKNRDEFRKLTPEQSKSFNNTIGKIQSELNDTSNAKYIEVSNDLGYARSPNGHYFRISRNHSQILTGKDREEAASYF